MKPARQRLTAAERTGLLLCCAVVLLGLIVAMLLARHPAQEPARKSCTVTVVTDTAAPAASTATKKTRKHKKTKKTKNAARAVKKNKTATPQPAVPQRDMLDETF